MALWTRVQGLLAGVALGRAASASAEGVFEVTRQNAWARRPFRTLPAPEAARVKAQGIPTKANLTDDARRDGFGAERFEALVEMTRTYPGIAIALDMWRRGIIDQPDFTQAMYRNGYSEKWVGHLSNLKETLPPVTDLIRFGIREVYNSEQRAFLDLDAEFPDAIMPDAERLGLSERTVRNEWAAHWQLPSYGQATQMLFRGELTRDQFRALLKAQDYAPTWRDKLYAIARAIPTMTDMSRLAVREVYNPTQRRALDLDAEFPPEYARQVAKHGMSEDDAKDLWAGHWRLPSAGQGYQMLFRGEITDAELAGLLKALDYAPVWRDRVKAIAYRVPGRVDLRRMFRYGVMTRAEVKRGYQKLGYTTADAETLTQFAEAEKAAAGSTDGTDYIGQAETQLRATTHRSFIAGESTPAQARTKLGQAGVPVADRDAVIAVWTNERELIRKQLTPAQIKKAWVKVVVNRATGVPWTREDAVAALIERGYSANDANEFLDLPPTGTT